MLLQGLLRTMIQKGTLRLITADGKISTYGDGTAPHVTFKLHRRYLEWTLALYPQLRLGEAYMDGLLTIEEGTLRDFFHVIVVNLKNLQHQSFFVALDRALQFIRRVLDLNPLKRAKRNIESHYDLSPKLYDLFLDPDRQYSCGYFTGPRVNLEQAQEDKKRHIASKLFLRQGMRVLDIGSGWGGLGLYLAHETGCDLTGITLSDEQFALSNERARKEGLAQHCRFTLRDYRREKGTYDRIVSVGMFEHVGRPNYDAFFAKIYDLLADDGVCLLHSISHFGSASPTNPFIRKHIFPGGEIPLLSDVVQSVEKSGLMIADIEILRLHYAETLRLWNERFQARRAEAAKIYDERFCRKWEFYLIGCEMSFRVGNLMVFQMQLCKRMNALPITRNYMSEWEELAASLPRLSSAAKQRKSA